MIRIQQILVPLDLDEYACHALPYARELCTAFAAGLHLLHVVDTQWLLSAGGAFPESGGDLLSRLERDGRVEVERVAGQVGGGIAVTSAVRVGPPHVQIVQYARESHIDLIVLATHGRSGLKHALIGSVAEKVVQMAPCPVLAVKHPEHEFVMP